eukprot:symbB.v1.2.009133.t1/scaffold577.1/size258142/8
MYRQPYGFAPFSLLLRVVVLVDWLMQQARCLCCRGTSPDYMGYSPRARTDNLAAYRNFHEYWLQQLRRAVDCYVPDAVLVAPGGDEESCPVCLEVMTATEKNKELACRHRYHYECLMT